MEDKINYINKILETKKYTLDKTPEYFEFIKNINDLNVNDKFCKFADVVLNNNEHESVVNYCRIMLLSKAKSGITGATTEKNIDYVFELLYKKSN